jgi:quinol monooxygenase YgiN
MHAVVAVVGGLVAAVGSGVLLTRCFRAPRGDLIAWSIGLLGLLVSLGAQAMGYVSGFDSAMFRAMEIGAQVIAPLAFLVALTEVSGRSALGRFCARLYIGALGIVALVVLALDQLTTARFSKAFPPAATFYQAPPNYVLMYAIGPLTALIAVISVVMVLARSGRPGWHDAVQGQLAGGVATLALAYPGLAEFASQHVKVHIPLGSVFAILCTLAAALAWLAGLRSAALPLAALHGQPGGEGADRDRRLAAADRQRGDGSDRARRYESYGRYDGADRSEGYGRYDAPDRSEGYGRYDAPDRSEGYGRYDAADVSDGADQYGRVNGYAADRDLYGDGGVYRGAGLYRPEPGRAAGGDDWADGRAADAYADFATGDFLAGDLGASDLDWDDEDRVPQEGWQSRPGSEGPDDGAEQDADRWHERLPAPRGQRDARRPHDDDDPSERRRAELFGQITIYTLDEDRVDAFDGITERVVAQVRRHEPDTLVFIAHAVPSAPDQRILYQVFRSRAAYQRHLAQPYVQRFAVELRPYVLATNVLELGLQQAKVSPFPSVTELFPEPGYDTSGFERPDYLRDYGRNPAQPGGGPRDSR